MLERQESGSVIDKVAASDVLRRVADHLDAGGSRLISLNLIGDRVKLLCRDSASWAEWVGEFDGHPTDAAYEKGGADPDLTFVDWSSPGVVVEYIISPAKAES
jgi:hypothetical protein